MENISDKGNEIVKVVSDTGSKLAKTVVGTTYFVTSNVKQKMPGIVIASLTLVAGLAWNSAFQSLINYYVPQQYQSSYNSLIQLTYALTLTIVIIIVIAVILRFFPGPDIKHT